MFRRKIKLVLTQDEYRYLVSVLVETRNKLLSENKYTVPQYSALSDEDKVAALSSIYIQQIMFRL